MFLCTLLFLYMFVESVFTCDVEAPRDKRYLEMENAYNDTSRRKGPSSLGKLSESLLVIL